MKWIDSFKTKVLLSCFFMFPVFSCIQNDVDFRRSESVEIDIYIVKQGQLQIHSKESEFDINKLLIENEPWVRNSEITFYDWSSHTFYLKNEKDKEKLSGRHFVVTANKKRLFAGVFFPIFLSSMPALPSIAPENDIFSPKDVVQFQQLGHVFTGEIGKKTEFREALIAAGLFRNGIDVQLTELKPKGATSLEYTFEVTNRDLETLYILDPDKMDCNFRHYSNGIWLKKNNTYIFSDPTKMCPVIEFKDEWYYKLKKGEKITRSIEHQGFSQTMSGNVTAMFTFPGSPVKKAGSWQKRDGRIWLGNFLTERSFNL